MASAFLPALFTCLSSHPYRHTFSTRRVAPPLHCPHVSRRSVGSFGNNGHPCGWSAIGYAATVRHTYRGFTWARPFGRPSRSFRLLSFPLSLILASAVKGFARGPAVHRSTRSAVRSGHGSRQPPPFVAWPWGWSVPVPRGRRGPPVAVPRPRGPWALGAWPASRVPRPVPRCPGVVAWALGLGPWGRPAGRPWSVPGLAAVGRPVVSVGVVSRGVRPAGGVPPRTTTPRRGWSLVRPSGARGVPPGPSRPRWGGVGRPSRPRWAVVVAVASVAFPRWPGGVPRGGRPVAVGRGPLRPGVPGRHGGGWSRCKASRVPRGGVAWRPLSVN